jgi:membrane-bound lytic murein transglycosylase B
MRVRLAAAMIAGVLVLGWQALTPAQDATTLAPASGPAEPPPFDAWLSTLIAEARARGFDSGLIDRTLVGLRPLPRVVASDRSQAGLVDTLERYVSVRVTPQVVRRGRELERTHARLLTRIEHTYGVPRQYLLSIWGLESRFGRLIGRTPVFQALATLAWEPRRADFFRGQLFDALQMVARGHIEPARMTGSWAGAMGQTQFMPSSYLEYAEDFDGDGRRDIWTSVPDSLASIANYLRGYGWQTGETWGREVHAPEAATAAAQSLPQRGAGCYAIRTMTARKSVDEWRQLGVRRVDGSRLPTSSLEASLATVGGRTFLVYRNYDAILGYNCAHFYALAVSMLADQIRE